MISQDVKPVPILSGLNSAMFRIDDRMRNAGITLILAGLALIGAIGLDVTKTRQTTTVTQAGLVTRQVTPIRFFSTVSTVLIILGIGATLVGKNDKQH